MSNSNHFVFILGIVAAIFQPGCGAGHNSPKSGIAPPTHKTRESESKKNIYTFVFDASLRDEFGISEAIDVPFEIRAAVGEPRPRSVVLLLSSKGVNVDSSLANPVDSSNEGIYKYSSKITTPNKIGSYAWMIQATKVSIPRTSEPSQTGVRTQTLRSEARRFEVRKGVNENAGH